MLSPLRKSGIDGIYTSIIGRSIQCCDTANTRLERTRRERAFFVKFRVGAAQAQRSMQV